MIDFVALTSFALITTFTPGPNNITSASMGVLYGYRKTLSYLWGVTAGFFLVMILSSLISTSLLIFYPAVEKIFRIAGAIYILWLAYGTVKSS
ncbi:MAG: LysE family transporter [Anaerolineales bacterium]|nr:LysE family transporter [Chloroflexota bacterium]MBL6980952.1 LysE family transporter [Anaerolineales bacterium]